MRPPWARAGGEGRRKGGRREGEGVLAPVDEDIPTITPSPIDSEELPVTAKNKSNDEIRTGPITRARAKLLEQ